METFAEGLDRVLGNSVDFLCLTLRSCGLKITKTKSGIRCIRMRFAELGQVWSSHKWSTLFCSQCQWSQWESELGVSFLGLETGNSDDSKDMLVVSWYPYLRWISHLLPQAVVEIHLLACACQTTLRAWGFSWCVLENIIMDHHGWFPDIPSPYILTSIEPYFFTRSWCIIVT